MSDTKHIVCPHCDAVNRLPATRVADLPKCGKCHQRLFAGHPIDLTEESFDRHITHTDIPVVVDFWAPWCGPCRTMAPAFERAAGELEPTVRLAKLNTETAQIVASRFRIQSIPTLALFRGGREIARQAGAMGATDIVRWVRSHST